MTVGDLKRILHDLPDDLPVITYGAVDGWEDIHNVEVITVVPGQGDETHGEYGDPTERHRRGLPTIRAVEVT